MGWWTGYTDSGTVPGVLGRSVIVRYPECCVCSCCGVLRGSLEKFPISMGFCEHTVLQRALWLQ